MFNCYQFSPFFYGLVHQHILWYVANVRVLLEQVCLSCAVSHFFLEVYAFLHATK